MWPGVHIAYNLPPWLCTKDPYKMLTLLIPGQNALRKDIDVFLRLLIDELKELWEEGIIVHDVASNNHVFYGVWEEIYELLYINKNSVFLSRVSGSTLG